MLAAGWALLHHLQLCVDMCAAAPSLQHFLRVCVYVCACVSRVPQMLVMSTRVSDCISYLCTSGSSVFLSLGEDIFPSLYPAGAAACGVKVSYMREEQLI